MEKVRLIHWNQAESGERAERIRSAGYEVFYHPLEGADGLKQLRKDPPAVFVIDLSRLPAQGRDVAMVLRSYKATRTVPLVFVDGVPEKVERIKKVLPDAVYTTWDNIDSSLKQALALPLSNPVVPKSLFDVYSSTPLLKKLGIKAGATVNFINAPKDFEQTLGDLPEGVTLYRSVLEKNDLIIWFVKSQCDLELNIQKIYDITSQGGVWIVWPKKTSDVESDLSQTIVRETGLANGLVDYKICAFDKIWSGLKFSRKKQLNK